MAVTIVTTAKQRDLIVRALKERQDALSRAIRYSECDPPPNDSGDSRWQEHIAKLRRDLAAVEETIEVVFQSSPRAMPECDRR